MKKLIALAALAAGIGTVVLAADPEIAWREKLRTVVTTNGLAFASSSAVTTTNTLHTPAFAGQFLFGGAGTGTNAVWVAKGLTTNDWVRVAP